MPWQWVFGFLEASTRTIQQMTNKTDKLTNDLTHQLPSQVIH